MAESLGHGLEIVGCGVRNARTAVPEPPRSSALDAGLAAGPIPDLAERVTVTALVAVSVEETPYVDVIDYWQPTEGNPVPVLDVEEAVHRACRDRQVISIVADPFRWTRSLQVLAGEGFPVLEYPQTPGRLMPATTASTRPW